MPQTTSNTAAAAQTYYKKTSQGFLRARLYIQQLGTKEQIDRWSGQTISTWRPQPVAAQTNPLTEGTAPADISIATNTYVATLLQYGAYVKITDLLEITGRSSFMDVAARVLGYNAAQTLDVVTQNEMLATWTQLYANNKTAGNIDAGDTLTAQQIRRLRKIMLFNNVEPGDDGLFKWVLSPDQAYDLFSDDKVGSLLDVRRRATNVTESIWKGEMTKFEGFRILASSLIGTTQVNGTTVYQSLVAGPDALLNVDVESMPWSLFIVSSDQVNQANPLAQIGTVGWKATYTAQDISDGVRAFVLNSAVSEQTFA